MVAVAKRHFVFEGDRYRLRDSPVVVVVGFVIEGDFAREAMLRERIGFGFDGEHRCALCRMPCFVNEDRFRLRRAVLRVRCFVAVSASAPTGCGTGLRT
jgi:hypothetical protein